MTIDARRIDAVSSEHREGDRRPQEEDGEQPDQERRAVAGGAVPVGCGPGGPGRLVPADQRDARDDEQRRGDEEDGSHTPRVTGRADRIERVDPRAARGLTPPVRPAGWDARAWP